MNEVQGVNRNQSFCLGVDLCPAHNFFGGVDLPYFAHGCIPMRRCVTHNHDPDMTLTFGLKVKFIGFLTCFLVRPITFFWFNIGLPYLARRCIIIRLCGVHSWSQYNVDLWPKLKFTGILTCIRVWSITIMWHMCLSLWENLLRTFMLPIQHWPLTSRSTL